MIRIGILGDIGSGKSFVAKNFGYPVFNADYEVSKLYEKNKNVYQKFKKILPEYIYEFPIDKIQLSKAILANNSNLKKIIDVVHKEIRLKMGKAGKEHFQFIWLVLVFASAGVLSHSGIKVPFFALRRSL